MTEGPEIEIETSILKDHEVEWGLQQEETDPLLKSVGEAFTLSFNGKLPHVGITTEDKYLLSFPEVWRPKEGNLQLFVKFDNLGRFEEISFKSVEGETAKAIFPEESKKKSEVVSEWYILRRVELTPPSAIHRWQIEGKYRSRTTKKTKWIESKERILARFNHLLKEYNQGVGKRGAKPIPL